MSLAIAIRYSLTRRAFSITSDGAEVLLLDYPSHQRRLLPLLAKTSVLYLLALFLGLGVHLFHMQAFRRIYLLQICYELCWKLLETAIRSEDSSVDQNTSRSF